ncbi:hypothetical protein STEG23_004978, partial [Scotinomys teguina]
MQMRLSPHGKRKARARKRVEPSTFDVWTQHMRRGTTVAMSARCYQDPQRAKVPSICTGKCICAEMIRTLLGPQEVDLFANRRYVKENFKEDFGFRMRVNFHVCSLKSNGGALMYDQVPMVEIDGMNLVQTRAILRYIAAKYNLYGRNLQEQAWIDMYVEGLRDLSDMIMYFPLSLPEEKEINLEYILLRATTRFFPVYEKVQLKHRLASSPMDLVGFGYAALVTIGSILGYKRRRGGVPSLIAGLSVGFLAGYGAYRVSNDKRDVKVSLYGSLMFQQVPMVEIDGLKLVQTKAILNYIATKYNLYGKDMKERAIY